MDSNFSRAKTSAHHVAAYKTHGYSGIAHGLHCSAMDYHVPATNSNKLILTQIARPVQVQQSHTVIYGTSNAREHKLEAVDTSGSGSEVACDELCSHCNVRYFENLG
ncbi:hypothetical protein OUZ56_028792 [Daphnia magna]|uniref:Uncharacterized protein n=1 Tax=Daphnia magna TaxID=35525 RepID=A0ABR0B4X8_9CRUS|nr:hypothetical protein OUZ56_028792 [Daphnia magna]